MSRSLKQKLVVILGPTASGKSELAVRLAKRYEGEIISADSRQVYTYLDVGSNKIPGKWIGKTFIYKGVPHHCIDFVDPKKSFTVSEYKKCADAAISDIANRNKVPILVGGAGLYINAVVDGLIVPEVPPNLMLRKKLEQKSVAELFRLLQKRDPARSAFIDRRNPRRLIRALEIIAHTKKPVPDIIKVQKYNALILGIYVKPEILTRRIQKRTEDWIKQGLIKEVAQLRRMKLPRKRIAELGFNYKYALEYLDKKINKSDLLRILAKENWRYVKRQITWFKRDKRIKWASDLQEADNLVGRFLIINP